ncbi:MAG TPA: prepilin-type N-terminal cleavage/methylation domain-containing protein [Tepidisphaeraceae bacterium]|nr:prepilin-type N-terminal cleavage/methylation domain-containing protein [Tepidisphaeraceae bacterium]
MSDLRFTISPVLPGIARRGFTFVEVLFAVMILGIGFIMVAAIFPVAIQQSKANRDDTAGIIVAKTGGKLMQSLEISQNALLRNGTINGQRDWDVVHPFVDLGPLPPDHLTLFARVKGNLISKADPHYAWVPLGYKLSQPRYAGDDPNHLYPIFSSYTVYIVAVACRTKSAYDDRDITSSSGKGAAYTFQPKKVYFQLKDGGLDPDTIQFCRSMSGLAAYEPPAAAEGAFVLVADDQYKSGNPRFREANGRLYRLGVKRPDLGRGIWELLPGYDMTNDWENIPSVDAPKANKPAIGYMIGRGYSDPSSDSSPVEGPAQDLFAMPVMINIQ